ncbi:hypothetical protein QOT17_002889 [Balamuthia mandrillaris]
MEKAVERREEEETTFGDTSEEEEDESTISALTKLLQRLPVTSTTSVGGAAPDLPTDPALTDTKHYDNSYGTDHSFPSLSSYGRSKRGDYDEDGDDEEEDDDAEDEMSVLTLQRATKRNCCERSTKCWTYGVTCPTQSSILWAARLVPLSLLQKEYLCYCSAYLAVTVLVCNVSWSWFYIHSHPSSALVTYQKTWRISASRLLILFLMIESSSDSDCARLQRMEVVAAWVLEKGLKSMPAVQAILEAVVKTNATPSRALQLLAAITQALTEREAPADHSSSFGNAHFESTWRQANTGTTCLFFLHQPLHLMAEKWEWSDIEHHVMALLHATNFITLPHRLSMATHLLSSAPLAARAIAHDTIGAILNTTKDFSSELETLLIPALAFCASVDDVERAHEVCNAIVRAVGVEEANRYLNDELGGWPAFQKKLFLLLAEPCIKELEMLVGNGPPAFSWEQPHAQLCREPYHFAKESEEEQQLLSFLRSTQQSTIIDGFHSYSSARSFAATHAKGAPSTHAYSATFAAKARYGDYCVVVVKTKEMYKQERSAYKKRCAELAALRARLAATDEAKTDQ